MQNRVIPAILTITVLSLAGIAVHEGYRMHAYDDGVGVYTVGFGTTRHEDGRPVQPGDSLPPERALVRLAQDVDRIQREIKRCIGDVPLFQYEWDAYVSLAYNIGSGAFCRSTLVKKLHADPPDYEGACREILRWKYAKGKELPGLVRRRQAEYRLCIGEVP